MATIIREIMRGYRYMNEEIADPRTKDWFLIGSPWPGLALLGFYLHFIYRLGPSLMANRPPMKLELVIRIYNIVQIVLSSYLFYKACILGWLKDYNYSCEPVDYSDTPRAVEIAGTVYLYFIVKIIDLLDTVFFVLRKKQNQISFLHVYHHTGMVMGSWGGVKYLAGGHATFLGLINSFVHVIMYTHYLVSSFKIANPWWKKYITQLQLIQFFLILVHFSQLLWTEDCGFPRWPAAIFIPQNIFMIVLFGDFYYQTYVKKKPQKKVAVEQNGQANVESSNGKAKNQ
ncbi:elongation of very long chain fatty acids protein AAEL008004 [Nasonia vitripennis]|uniref:Elongation of very long chain fatty acids protein n=1 Tax=Nasonia vitripennis TaxID=7425 RepID=A0A7M7G542_NASVI|nr:elongation of very long chain fatty acids protein AAEL008004 [Nasonia vitripennis]